MRKHKFLLLLLPACILLTSGRQANAQTRSRWKAHDMNRPRPPVVKPAAQALPVLPPADAIILFDGKDLSQWRRQDGGPAKWAVVNGYTESTKGSGYIYTRRTFGDIQLHVEWAARTHYRRRWLLGVARHNRLLYVHPLLRSGAKRTESKLHDALVQFAWTMR